MWSEYCMCSSQPHTKNASFDFYFEYANQVLNARCPKDAEFVEFTPVLRKIILNAHNSFRNQLAMGQIPRYPAAARMATMVLNLFLS